MKHCAGIFGQVTVLPNSNEYLANNTDLGNNINKTLENGNNEPDYLISSLYVLSNHLFNENGQNYDKLNLPNYKLLKELQQNYYSNPILLQNVICISGV